MRPALPRYGRTSPLQNSLCRKITGGDTSTWRKGSRFGRSLRYGRTYQIATLEQLQATKCSTDHQDQGRANPITRTSLGEILTPKEGMSIQTNLDILFTTLNKIKCFPSMCFWNIVYTSSSWKWWIVALLKSCKNLVCNFVLYEHLSCWYKWEHEPELNLCGSKCLWPTLGCCVVWYGATMLILLYLIVWWKSRMISFEK